MSNKYILDDAGRIAAAKIVDKWKKIAFRTGVMSDKERLACKEAAAQLYINADLTRYPCQRALKSYDWPACSGSGNHHVLDRVEGVEP